MQKYLQDGWFKLNTIYVHESKYYWNTTNSIHLYLDTSACKTCWWVLALKATLSTLHFSTLACLNCWIFQHSPKVKCSRCVVESWCQADWRFPRHRCTSNLQHTNCANTCSMQMEDVLMIAWHQYHFVGGADCCIILWIVIFGELFWYGRK